jgi:general secretion pathway protein A
MSLNKSISGNEKSRKGLYLDFYGFSETPFAITPDPGFLFLSRTHQSVIEKLLYGINNRAGFVLLTGEVGTGKTTVCRTILDRLEGAAETVYIINPSLSGTEILASILDDLGVVFPAEASKKDLMDRLKTFLMETDRSKPVVIIVDDAQTMPVEALEDLRLLSNLETDKEKLLQMVLVGQPELLAAVSKPELRQLQQRIAVSCTLDYLTKEEVSGYIERRLFVAGNKGQVRFTRSSVDRIFKASSGTPRLINRICDYSLIAGYLGNDHTIHERYVIQALSELGSTDPTALKIPSGKPYNRAVTVFIALAMLVSAFYLGSWFSRGKDAPAGVPVEIETGTPKSPAVKLQDELVKKPVRSPAPEPQNSVPAVQDAGAKPEPFPNSYTVLIASHRFADKVIHEASRYRINGVDSHWVKLDLGEEGIWYRHFAGRFKSKTEARQFIMNNGLTGARILAAPWAISVSEGVSPEEIGGIAETIRNNGYDCYADKINTGGYRLMVGAFVTREGAEKAAREIALTGVVPQVVLR